MIKNDEHKCNDIEDFTKKSNLWKEINKYSC